MTKNKQLYSEVVKSLSEKAGVSKADADAVVKALGEVLAEAIETRTIVALPGILALRYFDAAAKNGVNPGTGEAIKIDAKTVVRIDLKSSLHRAQDKLNGK